MLFMGWKNPFKPGLFLKAPAFADPNKTLAARQVFTIVRAFILSSAFLQILQIAIAPKITVRWLALLLGTVVVSLVLLEFVRRGHVRLAAFLLVLSLWLLISIFSWTASGLGARAAWGYFIVVFIAGMLLGRRMGIIAVGICSASTLVIALTAHIVSSDPIRFWLINTLYLVIVLLLQDLASRSIRESLARAQNELRERQMAENELRKSEERFRIMFESGPIGIAIADSAMHFLMVNRAFCLMVGYSEQELGALCFQDITHHEHVADDKESAQKLLRGEIPFYKTEKRYLKKGGGIVWGAVTVSTIWGRDEQFLHFLAMIEDITARKQAEKEKEQIISLQRATIESTADGILVIDHSGKITDSNQRFAQMWRIPDSVLAARDDTQALRFVLEQLLDPQGFLAKVNELYAAPDQESFDLLQFKDGRCFERYSRPQLISGKPLGRVWSFRDVSERKQGEEKLLESERRYRTLFESAGDAIFLLHGNLIIDCNSRTLEMFGCAREQIIGFPISRFHPPRQPDSSDSLMKGKEKNTAAQTGGSQFFEWRHVRFDGTSFDAEVSLNRVELGSGMHLLAIVRDISERKKLEEQLRQAQKMEAIGILAGGVAHDFNNILSTIVGYGSLLQIKMQADGPLKGYVERILTATERAANLTNSLLAFSRKQEIALRPLDINDTIYGFHKILARLIGEDIDFHLDLASQSLVVDADIRQIEQVLMNLANNSRDAMPRGGKLTIRSEAAVLKHPRGEIPAGSYAVVTVADSGVGMGKDVQAHIFEPFFTTKDVGKGTGLGLAIVYGIVKKHSGFIHMASTPGKGTAFSIYLPLNTQMVKKTARKKQDKIPAGSETILLIEDDAAVRQVTRSMLEEFGYTVLEAVDGIEAQTVFRQHQDRINLILCDLIMPKMNGRETFAEIQKMKTDVKVIFMSGYTSDIIAGKGIADSGGHLLLKPLGPAVLLKKIRDVLDGQ
jgi:two-component system cell cycle sensor histidine kinase/response regulator CckA